jgi:hypothetical protein
LLGFSAFFIGDGSTKVGSELVFILLFGLRALGIALLYLPYPIRRDLGHPQWAYLILLRRSTLLLLSLSSLRSHHIGSFTPSVLLLEFIFSLMLHCMVLRNSDVIFSQISLQIGRFGSLMLIEIGRDPVPSALVDRYQSVRVLGHLVGVHVVSGA